MSARRRTRYGASPAHLLLVLCSLALAGYAGVRLLGGREPWLVAAWFVGAALVHDLVLLPLYTVTDRAAQALFGHRPGTRRLVGHVRVPVLLSGLLLLTYHPLILGRVEAYPATTGLSGDVYLGRWLLITATLFAASALVLVVRLWRARARGETPA
ncbi:MULTISPECIES: hypothetical protein [Streptomyces]|uniref:hypothetical protein n=1 Tax=Streptomyces TaxID=1883 RepID=UPI00224877EB|nr:hypothetical protein [Streptomyces sp. JHD 1]MCX2970840.1 hypothetical protein [Streptomyces sp. JHD 1]